MKYTYERISENALRQEYRLGNAQEYVEMGLYAAISFCLPFILGHQQLLVGAAVNAALVLAALNLRGAKLLPVIMLPSIGAYMAGMVFGAGSPLLYLIPFIWIGNALLVLSVKELYLARGQNRFASLAQGAAWKSGFLFASAFALFSLGAIPAQFLIAMGVFQLATALLGSGAALAIQEGKKRLLAF